MCCEKNTKKSSRAEIGRQKREEVAMYSVARFRPVNSKGFPCFCLVSQTLCSRVYIRDDVENGFGSVEHYLNASWKTTKIEYNLEKSSTLYDSLSSEGNISARQSFVDVGRSDAEKVLEILNKDDLGCDAKLVLSSLGLRVSDFLVREVLYGILKTVNHADKMRCAKLGYKFFVWSGEQKNYKHTENAYNLMMKIFADTHQITAMSRLFEEMTEKGYRTTPRTFNILICNAGGAGIARKYIVKFLRSKAFNYRPYTNSYNAILHSLLTLNHYKLVEWVYRQMLVEGHSPDVLTFNIIMCAKFRLGKKDDFLALWKEMHEREILPDLHTYNLLLHVYGRANKPEAALEIMNNMRKEGMDPSVLHYTTLIDGLSRAGNLEACEFLFEEMRRIGLVPDVVSYTVMITGYIVAGQFDCAQKMFYEMTDRGQLPNVFTYNSMIRGLCMAEKFDEACLMLEKMESKGCNPNFLVYTTLVSYLRNAGRLAEAHKVIKKMVKKGRYCHRLEKIKRYRR